MVGAYMNNGQAVAAYRDAFRRLARMSGFRHQDVLRAEVGVILKTWAGRTKVTKPDQAKRRAIARALRNTTYQGRAKATSAYMTINSGARGGVPGRIWKRTDNNKFQLAGRMDLDTGGFLWNNIHWKDADFADMMTYAQIAAEAVRSVIPKALRAVALSRQSVIQIADRLGIDLTKVRGGGVSPAGIAKARAAIATTGVKYVNGTGSSGGDDVKAYVEIVNRLPYAIKIGMDRILVGVTAGRAKFIERAYEKGAFDTQRKIAQSFPNLFYFRS